MADVGAVVAAEHADFADVFLRLVTDNPGCALHVMRELSARVVAGNARDGWHIDLPPHAIATVQFSGTA